MIGGSMAGSDWSLTSGAFERLLEALGHERGAAAREYETMRRKLMDYFTWRGAPDPSEHADETLDRVARRLEEGEAVEHIRGYVYGVARLVLLETGRQSSRERAAQREWPARTDASAPGDDPRWACFDRCLQELAPDARSLIVAYYLGSGASHLEARKDLARRLGISYGTLKTRAHRVRVALERCVQACLGQEGGVS
jgi:DNA-directed RNA polymerase specialized sigma24 family protein